MYPGSVVGFFTGDSFGVFDSNQNIGLVTADPSTVRFWLFGGLCVAFGLGLFYADFIRIPGVID